MGGVAADDSVSTLLLNVVRLMCRVSILCLSLVIWVCNDVNLVTSCGLKRVLGAQIVPVTSFLRTAS